MTLSDQLTAKAKNPKVKIEDDISISPVSGKVGRLVEVNPECLFGPYLVKVGKALFWCHHISPAEHHLLDGGKK